jgi:UDP-GlcNAc:undecaprenyl-phosphate/decaprenyl-phosphate GlcNAc-1-phosphate transferase
MFREYIYIITPVLSFIMALFLVQGFIKICHRYSIYDRPGFHKRHKQPTPILGGTALIISFWLMVGILLFFDRSSFQEIKPSIIYILAGSLIIYFVGLIDDLRPLSAWSKLIAETVAGLILFWGGLSIKLLSIPGGSSQDLGGLSAIITVFWVICLTNAINLIDGLDGLATGVSMIAAGTMVIIGTLFIIDSVMLLSLILMGTLLAFWIFNRFPAKIFLGDSGALLIGYFFAVISLIVPIKSFTTAALFLPLVVLGVPLTEIVSSLLRRLAAGKNIMQADRRHIFHYLGHAGLSQKQIVNLFYLSGIGFSAISVTMFFYERALVLTFLILFMVVIFLIYFIFILKIIKR